MWLPPDGHIDKDETPDEALLREFKEELGVNITLLNKNELGIVGNTKRELAVPFHVNVHSVGDHDHCCLFYLCNVLDKQLVINRDELNDARWFSKQELSQVPEEVKRIALYAISLALKK